MHAEKQEGNIAITDKNFESAKILEKELVEAGIKAKAWELDITKEENIIKVFSEVSIYFGSIDVLINNAGTANRSPCRRNENRRF